METAEHENLSNLDQSLYAPMRCFFSDASIFEANRKHFLRIYASFKYNRPSKYKNTEIEHE